MWMCLAAEQFKISRGKGVIFLLLNGEIIYNDSAKKKKLNFQCIGSENVCKWSYFLMKIKFKKDIIMQRMFFFISFLFYFVIIFLIKQYSY